MCEEGTIYLIQPELLINTNKFKIGMSKKNDLNRLKSYHSGTRFICIMSCKNPLIIEKKIKDAFTLKYKLVAGNEYFEGNEEEILTDFFKIISENKNVINKEILIDDSLNEKKENECLSQMEEDRLLVENEFIKNMNLGLENEKEHIWAFIDYKQKDYKFRCVKRLLKDGDKNLLFAKVLIKYFAKKHNISCDDGLEVLADLAEGVINKIYNY